MGKNPLFAQLNGGGQQMPQAQNPIQAFESFMMQGQGQDPNAIISQLVQSGKLSQDQLNMVQQRAQRIMQSGKLDGLKARFGFR